MRPPSREAIRCAVRPGPPTIGLPSRTSTASQAAFSTKASGQAVAWRSVLRAARSRSLPVRRPSSLSAPVSASRRCWRCCMVRPPRTPGRLGRFGGCIQPAIGRTIRLPRKRTICSRRSAASHRCVIYSRPAPGDMLGQDFDRPGHLSLAAAPRARGSPGRRFLSVWSARLPRGFPERPGGMGHSLAQGPRRSVRARAHSHAGHLQRRRSLTASS